jgi:hypothetical protein
MATETIGIDLFVLLVEYVFGSILLSIIGWAFIMLVTGILGRVSIQSITIIIATFLAVSTIGYIGALAALPLFLWAAWYFTVGLLRYMNQPI